MQSNISHVIEPATVDIVDPSTLDIREVPITELPHYLSAGWENLKDYCAFLA